VVAILKQVGVLNTTSHLSGKRTKNGDRQAKREEPDRREECRTTGGEFIPRGQAWIHLSQVRSVDIWDVTSSQRAYEEEPASGEGRRGVRHGDAGQGSKLDIDLI
jgi:hypothetical protein